MPKSLRAFTLGLLLALPWLAGDVVAAESIRAVRLDGNAQPARLTLDLSGPVKYTTFTISNPERLVIDLRDTRLRAKLADVTLAGTPVKRMRSGIRNGDDTRIVLEVSGPVTAQTALLSERGVQLVIDLLPAKGAALAVSRAEEPVRATKISSNGGQRDVVIAIDAGHGGADPGAIGHGRLQEKKVVLAIAKELAELFGRERGYKAVLTRNGDYFLPLKQRRDLARKAQADLMVSIHADAFTDRSAGGGSVFALSNRGATSTMAAFLAESENSADAIGGVSVEGKDDDLVKVLTDLSLSATMHSSLRIGRDVLDSMSGVTRLHSSNVEQAAFVVLKSPDTPSILVETGFVSNPNEAKRLATTDYQRRMARAIFNGVNRYFSRNPPPNTYLATQRRRAATEVVSADDSFPAAVP